mgnify:CR=1 FL=1
MESWPLTIRIAGIILLWFLSVAPDLLASVNESAPRRQTEFNDRNYQPSRQINTTTPLHGTARSRAPLRERRIIQSRLEKAPWIDGRGTEQKYEMYYEHDGSQVTFASVCSNYRSGSIDYRNCRKAARQWFGTRCNTASSAGRMFCQASSTFRP